MKKEKSKVALTILTIFGALLLIISALLKNEESNCRIELEEMDNNKTTQWFWMLKQVSIYNSLFTTLDIRNYTSYVMESDKKLVVTVNPEFYNLTISYYKTLVETEDNIRTLEREITIKKRSCTLLSLVETYSLYVALIINLISIYFGLRIRRLYKT